MIQMAFGIQIDFGPPIPLDRLLDMLKLALDAIDSMNFVYVFGPFAVINSKS
jgi:hypothetical protein